MMKWLRQRVVMALLLGASVWCVLAPLRALGGLEALELKAYDAFLRLRTGPENSLPITLVGETEPDIRRFGHPLSDAILAEALEKLLALNARVIGVDKYRDIPAPPGTGRLEEILRAHDNIIWIFFIGNDAKGRIQPPIALEGSQQIAFNNIVDDPDGVSRRGLLFMDAANETHMSFPLMLALDYLAGENIHPPGDEQGYLRLGTSTFVPLRSNSGGYAAIDAAGYQFMLSYPALNQAFPTFTLSDLLDGKVPAEQVRNRVILLGAMAPSLSDSLLLPGGERRYGVEHHGQVVAQLLQTALYGYPVTRTWPDALEYAWLLLWCLTGGAASLWRGSMLRLSLLTGGGLTLLIAVGAFLFRQGWWIPLVPSVLGWLSALSIGIAWFSGQERTERQKLMTLFERHVSPQVAATLWEAREQFFAEGGVRPDHITATVLFTDLVGFTSVAEEMPPIMLMNWLNEYMEEMSAIIISEGGMVNKYIGDAILAVFGAPVKRHNQEAIAEDALHSVKAALRMSEKLRTMNEVWQQNGLPTIGMRIGIHTGPLVAGCLGGRARMEYTVIGDTVNTASRLESFDKTVAPPNDTQPCRILVGETTWLYIGAHYPAEEVGLSQLKGKQNALKIYRILERQKSN